MNTKILLVCIPLVLILIFIYDLESIEMKILGDGYQYAQNLQKEYDECLKNQKGALCDVILKNLNQINNKKPSILSSFFIWICDGFNTIFKMLSLPNLGLTVILIVFFRLFFKFT